MESVDLEIAVEQPAELLWQVGFKNFQVSMPAGLPNHFSKVEYMEGPPLAPGGVVKMHYHENFGHYPDMTYVWTEVDHEKYRCAAKVLDGGFLGKYFTDIVYSFQINPGAHANASLITWKFEFKDIGDHDHHDILKKELVSMAECLHPLVQEHTKA